MSAHDAHLTWRGEFARPFESFWSLSTRVCALNDLDYGELASLIDQRGRHNARRPTVDIRKSDWIDFTAYSELLQTDSTILQQGFLDTYGMDARNMHGVVVRHCPACMKEYFHCIFFDLAVVTRCPWHGALLAAPSSIQGTTRNAFLPFSIPLIRNQCRQWRQVTSAIKAQRTGWTFRQEGRQKIMEHGEHLLDWLKKIEICAPWLSEKVTAVYRENGPETITRRLCRGAAIALAGPLPDWTVSADGVKTRLRVMALDLSQEESSTVHCQPIPNACFSALRRHVVRQHLRGHGDCVRALQNIRRDGVPSFNGNVCTVALAYLTWQMAFHRICNIEGVCLPSPRLHGAKGRAVKPPFAAEAVTPQHMLAIFYSIWWELQERCEHEIFDVELAPDGMMHRVLQGVAHLSPENGMALANRLISPVRVVTYPDPRQLQCQSDRRCSWRRVHQQRMDNPSVIENYLNWSDGSKTGRRRQRLFQIWNPAATIQTKGPVMWV
jgi:hypothetical protein